jgi:hypothetical protein
VSMPLGKKDSEGRSSLGSRPWQRALVFHPSPAPAIPTIASRLRALRCPYSQ